MQIKFLCATIVASLVSVCLPLVMHAQGPAQGPARGPGVPATSISPSTAAAVASGTSVAVIDIKYIFENNARFKAAMDGVAKEAKTFDEFALEQRSQITKRGEKLKALEPGSPDYKRLEEEIAGMHTNLQLEFTRKQRDLADRRSKIFFDAYKEIEAHVAEFAERNGIQLVLRFDSSEMDENNRESVFQGVNRGVVFQRNRDITTHILDRLNRAGGSAPVAAPAAALPTTQRPAAGLKR